VDRIDQYTEDDMGPADRADMFDPRTEEEQIADYLWEQAQQYHADARLDYGGI